MAECHPVGFRWVMEAKRRGATVIHVDPRFTRTSAVADLHVPIRAGSDIAFLGGLVSYVLSEEKYFREYVVHYTNAATILREDFRDTEDLDGLFSGWDREGRKYDITSWQYEGVSGAVPAAGHKEVFEHGAKHDQPRGGDLSKIERDESLQHPRCVLRVLQRHFARYTPELVAEVCGIPKHLFFKVAEALCRNSGRERTSAFCYAVGWTQHSVGVQYIRTASILQLLLGNIGRPGGGIMALRGHSSIQGSTDIPTLFDLLPGYLPMPHLELEDSLSHYVDAEASASGWWGEFPKYIVSLLKAYFGDAANADNEYLYRYLPRLTGNHAHLTTVAEMAEGKVKGYFVMGENPVVGTVQGALHRKGLRQLDWLVVRDFQPTETAEFWREADEIESGQVRPEDIATEVFFFPAAAHTEKDGSFTNTQRLLQWHHKAVEPPGESRSDLHFVFHLGRLLKSAYQTSADPKDIPIQALTWGYPTKGIHQEPDAEAVLREINGYEVEGGKLVDGFKSLKDDGSTACGCWIYSGCYQGGENQTARRKPASEQTWVAPQWGWAWPMNRRLLYNRASADPLGNPWSERKKYVWWDEAANKWKGEDVPDFIDDRPPSYRPAKGARGKDTISGVDPFIMQADGKGWLFAPAGLLDGPLPTHYEPQESVMPNLFYGQQCNPGRYEFRGRDHRYHRAYHDPRYPFVLTTFRVTEHHTAGGMSRWLSWLSELQPEMFCEVSRELAAMRGLEQGGFATVRTARGEVECRVLITDRIRPLKTRGGVVHQIGLPYHWGRLGRVRGDAANELFPFVADPNVNIPESKVCTGDIVAGRRSRAPREEPPEIGGHLGHANEGRDLPGVPQRSKRPHQSDRNR